MMNWLSAPWPRPKPDNIFLISVGLIYGIPIGVWWLMGLAAQAHIGSPVLLFLTIPVGVAWMFFAGAKVNAWNRLPAESEHFTE